MIGSDLASDWLRNWCMKLWAITSVALQTTVIYMGKEKFRTGKFRSEIVFNICTNQFLLAKNCRESLKLVSKMGFNVWNTNFRLEHPVRNNRTTFSNVPLLPEILHGNDLKIRVPFAPWIYFSIGFPRDFW